MRRKLALSCIRATALGLPLIIACSSNNSSGPVDDTGNGNGGNTASSSRSGSSGSHGSSSSGRSGSSSSSRSTGTGGSGATGAGGSGGTSGNTGSGSSASGSNGSGNGGGGGGSDAGMIADSGGTSNPDASRSCSTAPATSVISDFEEGLDVMVKQQNRDGVWSTYQVAKTRTATPALNSDGTMPASAAPSDDHPGTCNAYAMHVSDTSSGCLGTDEYCGFNAPFNGTTNNATWTAYDVSAYDGIQFDIKAGSSSQGPVYFEVLTKETQPSPAGTASNTSIDEYNNRGYLLSPPGSTPTGTSTPLPTTTTTVYVPFASLIPRWFPSPTSTDGGTTVYQAPSFVPKDALGLQFSVYKIFSTAQQASYDLWLDNVAFYNFTSANEGLVPPGYTMPAFKDGSSGWSCTLPTFMGGKKAAGKYLLWAYRNWRTNYVREAGSSTTPCTASSSSCIVISPEVNNGSVVSEGIAYGLLIAAYMGDQKLFDQLWAYWSKHAATGMLMNWRYDITGSNPTGTGSATDSDEDAAFALYVASKVFTTNASTYASTYTTMLGQIWSSDFNSTTNLPTYGSNAGTSSGLANPSYFAPAYYQIFGGNFTGAVSAVYKALGNIASQGKLPPAWCQNDCQTAGSGGQYANDTAYQYDAHRVPWRIGIDYCWNNSSAASNYLSQLSKFFAAQDATGVDSFVDEYTMSGSACTNCSPAAQPNSMSMVGTAGVGALAGGASAATFVNDAWQFVLDGLNRGKPDVSATGSSYYTYFNTTVGLLTAITLSGNFYKP